MDNFWLIVSSAIKVPPDLQNLRINSGIKIKEYEKVLGELRAAVNSLSEEN